MFFNRRIMMQKMTVNATFKVFVLRFLSTGLLFFVKETLEMIMKGTIKWV